MSESDESREKQRAHIAEAMQDLPSDSLPAEAYLTGFMAAAEYVDATGRKYFRCVTGDPNGDCLSPWTAQGLAHYALYQPPGEED